MIIHVKKDRRKVIFFKGCRKQADYEQRKKEYSHTA